MDYYHTLKVAAAKQTGEVLQKRYSLAVGPPKKDPKVKGVESAAVRAFLRKKEQEMHQKELEEKKKREHLLAKRKELKHDKKARAMASRTKDNFRGYNGIPVEDKPRKRQSSPNIDHNGNEQTENEEYLMEEELYEYSQTESELEEVEEPPPPPKKQKLSNVKKAPPPAMNFAELMRLAEVKQFEPVEIVKPVKKNVERPRTAEEIREVEFLERKNSKIDRVSDKNSRSNGQIVKIGKGSSEKHSSSKGSHSSDKKSRHSSTSNSHHEKVKSDQNGTLRHSDMGRKSDKPMSVSHSKNLKVLSNGNPQFSSVKELGAKHSSSSRSELIGNTHGKSLGSARPGGSSSEKLSSSLSSVRLSGSTSSSSVRPSNGSNTQRPLGPSSSGRPSGGSSSSARPSSVPGSSKSSGSSSSSHPSGSSGSNSVRPSNGSGSVRPPFSSSSGASRPSSGGPLSSSGSVRTPSASGASRPGGGPPVSCNKPKNVSSGKEQGSSSVRPSLSSSRIPATSGPGRPGTNSALGLGPKPKCTVVSETISSKNFIPRSDNAPANVMSPVPVNAMRPGSANGMRPGPVNGMRPGSANGMRPAPPTGHRLVARPPGPPLPPITSSYKRRIDEEDYDSEMEDFIDDGGESQDEISKHIREIFGYDRTRYKDESDYALRYMESSFREQQKEEARSLRLGIQEDLEELRREEEELKAKAKLEKAKTKKNR